jgi:UDP-N-acetylmuramoyl-tripeptide--D-alanyl-D-alanine ligase
VLTASAGTIASVAKGEVFLGRPDLIGNGLTVDSRLATPGCIFAALPGERVDGHDFVIDALERGARILLVMRGRADIAVVAKAVSAVGAAVIRVDDPLLAVQELAAWHRAKLHAAVIGVTGSTGKTTTKDFLTAVLGPSRRVVATQGNRNNELGVPLTLFEAGSETDVLVVEMGMRGLGQIARLAEIARPEVGLVTNVGTSHLELLGSQDAVAAAKGELVQAIEPDGAVFLNGDDAYSDVLAIDSHAPVSLYGTSEHCVIRAVEIALDSSSRASFVLQTASGSVPVSLPVPGRHNVYNALAAAAVGLHLAVSLDEIATGLADAAITGMRMESFLAASGVTVINDAYNANPSSMKAAVETLSTTESAGRRVAVLGDMAELGSLSELAHFQIGEQVARLSIEILVTVGERASRIADGASAEGADTVAIRPCATSDEASEVLDDILEPGDVVLVKASRVMGLERVVEGIVNPRVR